MTIDNRLYTVLFRADRERHIVVKTEICGACLEKSCTFICPAGCYQLVEDKIEYSYEGCLECGACRQVCDREAIDWKYPRGGFGICLRYG
jgi:ferredoxin like protein